MHKHVERPWRDLLVAEWKKHPDSFTPEPFRFFRRDREIAEMLLASRYRAIPVAAEILGEDAIPLLREKLKGGGLVAAAAIYGLQLVSHTHISTDGKVQRLTTKKTLHEFLNQEWFLWSAARRQAVIDAWSKLILPRHER